MAKSPSHKFGQIIGDSLELAIEPLLRKIAEENHLYLDKQGYRKPARLGRFVRWKDENGNVHNLDFVLEKEGDQSKVGSPVAFIECAWRRYTRHSRNKAQEIQGAIKPLESAFKKHSPFIGVVLAGVFTEGAIKQLESLGFTVLYFPYENIINAFNTIGINAFYDEQTTEIEFTEKIQQWDKLSDESKGLMLNALIKTNKNAVERFVHTLEIMVNRNVVEIKLFPIHGEFHYFSTSDEAIKFIEEYPSKRITVPLEKYEIEIRYSNGDKTINIFKNRELLISYLRTL